MKPNAHLFHGTREAIVLAVDSDPTASVWIRCVDDPDRDAIVRPEDLAPPCAICERAPGTLQVQNRPFRVCRGCLADPPRSHAAR